MTVKSRNHHRHNHNISNDVERIKAALFDTTQDLREQTGEMIHDSMSTIQNQSAKARDNMADYTARKPFQALGVALLAGITIGFFIRR